MGDKPNRDTEQVDDPSQRHEGNLIHALLKEKGLTVASLARACNVAWPAAQKYVLARRLGRKAWETCRQGLLKLEIDPAPIRETAIVWEPAEDLKPKLMNFSRDQLVTLLKILKADVRARDRLKDAIEGILLWHPEKK